MKVKVFLFIEMLLLVLALFWYANHRMFLVCFIIALVSGFGYHWSRLAVFKWSTGIALTLLCFIGIWNPFIWLGILLAMLALTLKTSRLRRPSYFNQVLEPEAQSDTESFDTQEEPIRMTKRRLISDLDEDYLFEDVNLMRFISDDVLDLSRIVVSDKEAVIILRKVKGKTKIIVPDKAQIILDVSAFSGDILYQGRQDHLKAERVNYQTRASQEGGLKVRIYANILFGELEVVHE